jgi:hypothetical protein
MGGIARLSPVPASAYACSVRSSGDALGPSKTSPKAAFASPFCTAPSPPPVYPVRTKTPHGLSLPSCCSTFSSTPEPASPW